MEKKIIVIAGTHRQYGEFLATQPIEERGKYIEGERMEKMAGVITESVMTIGTWYDRKDRHEAIEFAESRVR
jgi:hypothetical protein